MGVCVQTVCKEKERKKESDFCPSAKVNVAAVLLQKAFCRLFFPLSTEEMFAISTGNHHKWLLSEGSSTVELLAANAKTHKQNELSLR